MSEPTSNESEAMIDSGREESSETGQTEHVNHVLDKRSRLISASLMTVMIVSLVSVFVFGIFHVTGRLWKVCPAEIPINDPAPVLWQDIISEQIKSAKLGVPDKINDVYLKAMSMANDQPR